MSTTVEHVLVVPTLLLHEVGYFQGFMARTGPYLNILLDPAMTCWRPRDEMETDPSYKQLIPYCLFRHQERYFTYRRGSGQGEGRLHGKRSVGVGGHISTDDDRQGSTAYLEGLRREIEEEVILGVAAEPRLIGLINDDSNDVGKVHLGLVHLFELEQPAVRPREAELLEAGFASPDELRATLTEYETWSQICLRELLG